MKTLTSKDQRIAALLSGMTRDQRASALIEVALRWGQRARRKYVRKSKQ